MKTDRQHFYRFVYLKSDHWANLRLEKLASVKGKCKACEAEHWNNDVHHLDYKNLYDVTLNDLVVLCRKCHETVHEFLKLKRQSTLPKSKINKLSLRFATKQFRKDLKATMIREYQRTYSKSKLLIRSLKDRFVLDPDVKWIVPKRKLIKALLSQTEITEDFVLKHATVEYRFFRQHENLGVLPIRFCQMFV